MQTKAKCYEHICSVTVWSYVSLWVAKKTNSYEDICWVSVPSYLSLRVSNKAHSHEDICWPSVSSYVSLWISNKSEFWWRHLLSVGLELCKFMNFKQKRFLPKIFFRSQFKVTKLYEFQTKANSYEGISWASGQVM